MLKNCGQVFVHKSLIVGRKLFLQVLYRVGLGLCGGLGGPIQTLLDQLRSVWI